MKAETALQAGYPDVDGPSLDSDVDVKPMSKEWKVLVEVARAVLADDFGCLEGIRHVRNRDPAWHLELRDRERAEADRRKWQEGRDMEQRDLQVRLEGERREFDERLEDDRKRSAWRQTMVMAAIAAAAVGASVANIIVSILTR